MFLQHCSRYNTITKLQGEEIVEWIIFHPNVNPSCVSSNVVTVLNLESDHKEVFPNMLMYISVRYLQNYMIKTSANDGLESVVDYVTQKVLIPDTTLR